MSSFADGIFAEFGSPVLQEYIGEQPGDRVYLTPRGGERIGPFECIVGGVVGVEENTEHGLKKIYRRTLRFPFNADLPFWGTGPTVGTVAVIGGEEWSIDLVESLTESYATVRVVRHTPVEVSRPGFRRV